MFEEATIWISSDTNVKKFSSFVIMTIYSSFDFFQLNNVIFSKLIHRKFPIQLSETAARGKYDAVLRDRLTTWTNQIAQLEPAKPPKPACALLAPPIF